MGCEQEAFTSIASGLQSPGVKEAFSSAAAGKGEINLPQELRVINRCFEKVNVMLASTDPIHRDFAGVRDTKILLQINNTTPAILPNPFAGTDSRRTWILNWSETLNETIKTGNEEIKPAGTVYMDPSEINGGNPLSVFEWYLYDGAARMVAIHLGFQNKDQEQENAGDSIACALTEAAVVLAEEGDSEARDVVKNMLDMKFIVHDWAFAHELVVRAEKVANSQT
ncbi:MAG TPA: hypothetical protein VG965_05865 [Patescibacteria group bacterium]|nr:hypothetical protein [Patescibacteria group bacterium]